MTARTESARARCFGAIAGFLSVNTALPGAGAAAVAT